MTVKTTYLKNYQEPSFCLTSIELQFDIFDDHTLVTSKLDIVVKEKEPIILNAKDLKLLSIEMDGEVLDESYYTRENDDLCIVNFPNAFKLKIITEVSPQYNKSLTGLFVSENSLCTQCEPEGFRKITFFPDRPDVMTVYTTIIRADKNKYPILLSNGNLVDKGELSQGRHFVKWHDPFKKPSYLFALVAGDFAKVNEVYVTKTGRKVDLNIFVSPGQVDDCQYAMSAIKKAMQWDEYQYNLEYDLDSFNMVSVRHFNSSGMENKGLNILNAKHIIQNIKYTTDEELIQSENIIAHEYFHNWTGNRVTCRDWFQLSLKEGLTVFKDQEFTRNIHSSDSKRIMDVKIILSAQFPEDAGSFAHPVQPDAYQEISNFYTATVYYKGAEIIRMLHSLLGQDAFKRGMDEYFKSFDGQAVTIDDFIFAQESANAIDLMQFKRWYTQAGTPEVSVETYFDNGIFTIQLQQLCPKGQSIESYKPLFIPIKFSLFEEGSAALLQSGVLELKDMNQEFSFGKFSKKPILSLLQDFSAPIKVHYNTSIDEQLFLARIEKDGFAKWTVSQSLMVSCMHDWLTKPKQQWIIPDKILNVFKDLLLENTDDGSCKADILSFPWHHEVTNGLYDLDIQKIEEIRDHFRLNLCQHLYQDAKNLYDNLWLKEANLTTPLAMADRKMRNACLLIMMKGAPQDAASICYNQFSNSENMTDQFAAFSLLINSELDLSDKVSEQFYQQWQNNSAVIDKWFTAQALIEKSGTLSRIQSLTSHPNFNLYNPNNVMALVGMFALRNQRHFHAKDGSGYQFLANFLLKLDGINSSITTYLFEPFLRYRQMNKKSQILMQEALSELSKHPLSNALSEKVNKTIEKMTC